MMPITIIWTGQGAAAWFAAVRCPPLLLRKKCLTHTLTHWSKSPYGFSGHNSSFDLILLGQKCHESTAQQGFDQSLRVGKDEVGGSNPPSSSRKTPEIFGFWVFSFAFCNFYGQLKLLKKFWPHKCPQTAKKSPSGICVPEGDFLVLAGFFDLLEPLFFLCNLGLNFLNHLC